LQAVQLVVLIQAQLKQARAVAARAVLNQFPAKH
jgi:hypothetical protein